MDDLSIAKSILMEKELTLAIVKNGEVIYTSTERGIKPIYSIANHPNRPLKGASAADKVTGKAAALLYKHAGLKSLYTNLISEKAVDVLKGSLVEFEYNMVVPFIKNRDKSGMCPVESMSLEINDIDELNAKISDFINEAGR